jgi:hypothetical protein
MSDDDDLRDEFGARLTAALDLRSQRDDSTETVSAVRHRADRQRVRRRIVAGACAIAAVAAAVLLVVGLDRGGDGVRTIVPSNTTQKPAGTTSSPSSSSSSTAPSSTTTLPRPQPKIAVVTAESVGSLRFGIATAADVRSKVGTPDADVRGSFGMSTVPGYQALGYGCSSTKRDHGVHIGAYGPDTPPYCRTVYFINVDTRTLAGFLTTASGYATAQGTTVGMTDAAAARREGRPAIGGCFTGIQIGNATPSGQARMFVFVGVHPNDQVTGIAADNPANSIGSLFC